MRKYLLLVLFVACNISVIAQGLYKDDFAVNDSNVACFINNTFVKAFIGFDDFENLDVTNLSKQTPETPIIINGRKYNGQISVTCNKNINFSTLEDVKKKNFPDVTGNILYMIDDYLIMTDVELYKLDADFIAKCVLIPSKCFDVFKNQPSFSIIRVYTKRGYKIHDGAGRLR